MGLSGEGEGSPGRWGGDDRSAEGAKEGCGFHVRQVRGGIMGFHLFDMNELRLVDSCNEPPAVYRADRICTRCAAVPFCPLSRYEIVHHKIFPEH